MLSCTEVQKTQHKNLLPANSTYTGIGDSGLSKEIRHWTIKVLENDSVQILCSYKRDSLDQQEMDFQTFGKLIPAEDHLCEFIMSNTFAGSGCDKPDYQYIQTDTIPIYIDSTLLEISPSWNIEVLHNGIKDTSITLSKPISLYTRPSLADIPRRQLNFIISPSNNICYPMRLNSGVSCGVYLSNLNIYYKHPRYLIKKEDEQYELIIDETEALNMQGKECPHCIEHIPLELN